MEEQDRKFSPVLILAENAEIDCQNDSGMTPLHEAVSRCALEPARILLQAGAKTSLKTTAGDTALHLAVWSGDLNVVELLLNFTDNSCFPRQII